MSPRPKTAPDAAILEAAARLLARHGPARLRLEDVAREVGLSPATQLLRFKSKRKLLLAVAEHGISGMAESFQRVPWRSLKPKISGPNPIEKALTPMPHQRPTR